jgi:hypothetical protein
MKRDSNNPFFLKRNATPHEHICICGEKQCPCTILDCRYPVTVQTCGSCYVPYDEEELADGLGSSQDRRIR